MCIDEIHFHQDKCHASVQTVSIWQSIDTTVHRSFRRFRYAIGRDANGVDVGFFLSILAWNSPLLPHQILHLTNQMTNISPLKF